MTVFHEAGATGQIEVAEMLLKRGGDINANRQLRQDAARVCHRQQEGRDGGVVAGARREITLGSFESFGLFESVPRVRAPNDPNVASRTDR